MAGYVKNHLTPLHSSAMGSCPLGFLPRIQGVLIFRLVWLRAVLISSYFSVGSFFCVSPLVHSPADRRGKVGHGPVGSAHPSDLL